MIAPPRVAAVACDICRGTPGRDDECINPWIVIGGEVLERLRNGRDRCPACGTGPGGLHHQAPRCWREECPLCWRSLAQSECHLALKVAA
jgi:hypothetical protein